MLTRLRGDVGTSRIPTGFASKVKTCRAITHINVRSKIACNLALIVMVCRRALSRAHRWTRLERE